jgi:shikimate kinase
MMRRFPGPGQNLAASSLRRTVGASILLMGPPGAGKTSVGRLLASRLKMPLLDVDNDWLEPRWGVSVGEKLKQLGDDAFLDLEDATLAQLDLSAEAKLVSLTGSNPLRAEGLKALSRHAVIVYLDCAVDTIVQRLEVIVFVLRGLVVMLGFV